jgi:hypothetical protein
MQTAHHHRPSMTETAAAFAFLTIIAAIGLAVAIAGAQELAEPPCDPTTTDAPTSCTYGTDD